MNEVHGYVGNQMRLIFRLISTFTDPLSYFAKKEGPSFKILTHLVVTSPEKQLFTAD